jgi:hypothetical protein
MVTKSAFLVPRKYDFRSGYLDGRKDAMMERVNKICRNYGIENNIGIKTNSSNIFKHNTRQLAIPFKIKTFDLLALLLLIVILFFLTIFIKCQI